jgi:hypothetical protein
VEIVGDRELRVKAGRWFDLYRHRRAREVEGREDGGGCDSFPFAHCHSPLAIRPREADRSVEKSEQLPDFSGRGSSDYVVELKTARAATVPRKTITAATYPIAFNGCSLPSFRNHCVLTLTTEIQANIDNMVAQAKEEEDDE